MKMNIIKSGILVAASVSMLMTASCEGSSEENAGGNDTIALSADSYTAGPETAQTSVTVKSSGDWRAVCNDGWIHLSADAGKDGETVIVDVDANDTGAERKGTVKFFTGSAVKAFDVVCGAGYMIDVLSRTSVELEPHSQLLEVQLRTNVDAADFEYKFTDAAGDPASWISFANFGSRVGGISLATFQVEENPFAEERSGVLTISGKGITRQLDVLQYLKKYINVTVNGETNFDIVESTLSISIDASIPYEFEMSDWISLESNDGNGNYVFKIAAGEKTRTGFITVFNPDMPPYTTTITVKQVNSALPEIEVPDDTFRKWLLDNEWITPADDKYIMTDAGMELTEMSYVGGGVKTFKGIETFSNLEKIHLESKRGWDSSAYFQAEELDLSALTNVKTLELSDIPLSVIKLGDNPIDRLYIRYLDGWDDSKFQKYSPTSFTVSGSKVKKVEIPLPYSGDPDNKLETIDVSGCPSLEYLDIQRKFNTRYQYKLRSLKMTSSQKLNYDMGLLTIAA